MVRFRREGTISRHTPLQRGAVAVEMAVITPVIVLLACCTIDVAQYINSAQFVSNASREGARKACRFNTVAIAEVEQTVFDYLANAANVPASAVQVTVSESDGDDIEPGELPEVESGEAIGVRVTLSYDAIRWMNWMGLLDGSFNRSTTFARKE